MSSDHWWLKLSIFSNFSDEKKKIIQEDLYFYVGLYENYDISIFDDVRLNLITDDPMYDLERQKIYKLPVREPFEIRKAKLDKMILSTVLCNFK